MVRIGIVGYGTGGQHFHTPFVAAAKDCELAGIVARADETIAKARADWPNIPIFPSLTAMIARALHEMGYDGPVGMEAFARDKEEDALHAFRAAFTL